MNTSFISGLLSQAQADQAFSTPSVDWPCQVTPHGTQEKEKKRPVSKRKCQYHLTTKMQQDQPCTEGWRPAPAMDAFCSLSGLKEHLTLLAKPLFPASAQLQCVFFSFDLIGGGGNN